MRLETPVSLKVDMHKGFVVMYRTGGRENFQWKRSIVYDSFFACYEAVKANRRMGYESQLALANDSLPTTYSYFGDSDYADGLFIRR